MTVKQIQKQVVKKLDINKMNNEYYSFNIVDIRKLGLSDVIDYLDDTEKHYISDMIKQGAYYMLLVVEKKTQWMVKQRHSTHLTLEAWKI